MVCAGEWEGLENGSRWRIQEALGWESLENGSRWRMGGAGEWKSPEKCRRQRNVVARENLKGLEERRAEKRRAGMRQLVNVLARRYRGTRWREVYWICLGGLERIGLQLDCI